MKGRSRREASVVVCSVRITQTKSPCFNVKLISDISLAPSLPAQHAYQFVQIAPSPPVNIVLSPLTLAYTPSLV